MFYCVHIDDDMKKIIILSIAAVLILTMGHQLLISQKSQEISEKLGGITRVAIGTQTKWTTDLVPSSSFTVNLGSLTLTINNIFTTGASLSGNLNFLGELKPDNAICSNGQILKKTGANNWDCAADAVASNSLDFDEFVNAMTLDANLSIASTSNNYTWDFLDTQVSFAGGRILTNGFVGIGTTVPTSIFNVVVPANTVG